LWKAACRCLHPTYRDVVVFEALGEHTDHGILVLPLNDARGGGKDSESSLSQTGLGGLAGLEENAEKFGPLVAYIKGKMKRVRINRL